MLKLKPYSSSVLVSGGFLLGVMGIYFIFLRPALLPEDYKYIGTTSSVVMESIPQLSVWLQKVFVVLGSYIFTTGIFTVYVALTSFRKRTQGAFGIVAITGLSSIAL